MQEYVQVILGVALVVSGFLLIGAIAQNIRIRRELQESETDLLDSYQSLELAYDKVWQEKEALPNQCEKLKKSKERMQKTVYTDYMTCLPNRFGYSEFIEEKLQSLKKDEKFAIVNMDIDNFKLINESYSHSSVTIHCGRWRDVLRD